ncbi:neutrophil gelatinase-associated lipocalin-like [Crocuta crocuta]
MAQCLLWLGLALLGALHTQAQDSTSTLVPAPPLRNVPRQPHFQDDQFQGKWYVLGLAGNEINKEKHRQFKVYTTTYELNEDYTYSYNVTSTLSWNLNCSHWFRTFDRTSFPGLYTLGNIEWYTGIQRYVLRVASTDYKKFAMVFFKKIVKQQAYFTVALYGRTIGLTPELKENFTSFVKSMGLRDEHIIFSIPIDECMDK